MTLNQAYLNNTLTVLIVATALISPTAIFAGDQRSNTKTHMAPPKEGTTTGGHAHGDQSDHGNHGDHVDGHSHETHDEAAENPEEIHRIAAPDGMSIEFTGPQMHKHITAGDPLKVTVKTEGMDNSGDHWHIYVDDELAAMVGAGRSEYILETEDLDPGEHTLLVTISNGNHEEYNITDQRMIMVK